MNKSFTISILAVVCASYGQAQTLDDALRYSETNTLGTARSLGTANSMSAIGADFTALQSNPAGLAAFRRNEFTFTVAPIISGTKNATFNRSPTSEETSGVRFSVPQAAFVFTVEPIGSRWTQVNFGVGISQTNRFEERVAFTGTSPGSISDWFLETSNNYVLDAEGFRTRDGGTQFLNVDPLGVDELNDYDNGLAYSAGVLIPNGSNEAFPDDYESDYDAARLSDTEPGAVLEKEADIRRKGYASSIDLSVAGNYDEKFLFGATLGLARSSFEESGFYRERDALDSVGSFDALTYRPNLDQTGTGIFARFGVIYRASQALRFGLAYHSPTVWSIDDAFTSSVQYDYTLDDDPTTSESASREAAVQSYRITTPSAYRASVGAIIGRRGFVSAEVGYLDYSGAGFRIEDDPSDFDGELNSAIGANFESAVNARLGGEINLDPFQVRLGGEYLGASIVNDKAALGWSAGVGWKYKQYFVDLGYRMSIRADRRYRPYNVQVLDFPQPEATYTPTLSMFALTLGAKFGQ